MSAKQGAAHKPATTDLSAQYRPLGLKAVLAAAMMVKPKTMKKSA